LREDENAKVSKRRRNTHRRPILAWIAILAMMIDALLPTTVSAAAASGAPGPSIAICGGAGSAPAKQDVPLPTRHCALCCGLVFNLTPGRHGYLTFRRVVGPAHAVVQSYAPRPQRPIRNDVQPRAPPELA
jgi:DUF2946 family protein